MMHKNYNPDRYTRKSLRLRNRDYTSASAYYVTIRTINFEPLFHEPQLRKILQEIWQALPKRFKNISLDEFIIMPDHIQFILWLNGSREQNNTLGKIVGAYKSLTTVLWIKYLKSVKRDAEYLCRIWQGDYFERVLRIGELEQKRQYIRQNPLRAGICPFDHPEASQQQT